MSSWSMPASCAGCAGRASAGWTTGGLDRMKCVLTMSDKGLRGASEDDEEAYQKFKRRVASMQPGDALSFEWKRSRNLKQHRKLMALLRLVADQSETFNTIERALVAVKMIAGYTEPMIDPRTGEVVQTLQSIAFANMDQDEFERFFGAAVDGVIQHIATHLDRATADRLIDMVIEGWT